MGYAALVGQRTVSSLEHGVGSVEQYMNAAAALGLELDAVIEYISLEHP